MSSNINFGDYLLANEKWLNDKPDSKVNHNTDGVLSSSEISVFFTEHLNFVNNQGELEANKDSFDAWYKENEKNISSFLESQNIENNDDAKQALYESISTFITNNKNAISVISDDQARDYANNLFSAMKGLGTHKDTVRAILEESNLSDADLVKVMDNYNKNHSSLIQDIHGDFSSETRKNYENLLANTLIRQVRNGDETALKLLCKEIHNSTSGMTGTANVFIKKIFDTAESADDGSEIMKKIKDNYSKYNSGEDIYTAIRGDFSFSTEDKYVQILDNAG